MVKPGRDKGSEFRFRAGRRRGTREKSHSTTKSSHESYMEWETTRQTPVVTAGTGAVCGAVASSGDVHSDGVQRQINLQSVSISAIRTMV